jgi:hypothetical protein
MMWCLARKSSGARRSAVRVVETSGTFEEAVASSSPLTQELARALRALVSDVYPDAVEVAWARQKVVGYGIGPKKMTEHFCYIAPHGEHVNLGFNYGAVLPDPDGLLEGTGKTFRHVKVRSLSDAKRPALRALIEAAIREREAALGPGPSGR